MPTHINAGNYHWNIDLHAFSARNYYWNILQCSELWTWMLQFKHLLSVPFFFIMNKYMTEHVVFNVNAGNYHWNIHT